MKRILLVGTINFNTGGTENFLTNALGIIDVSKYSLDYICPGKIVNHIGAEQMKEMGINFIELGMKKFEKNTFILEKILFHIRFLKHLIYLCRQKHYDVIHVNTDPISVQAYSVLIGRLFGIPKRISHSHNTGRREDIVRAGFRKMLLANATDLIACSYPAAISLFGKKFAEKAIIMKYGIDAYRFKFSIDARYKCREVLDFSAEDFVIGHVGRFAEQKNHRFLIKVFYEIIQKCKTAKLLLLGEGDLEKEVHALVKDLGLEKKVVFAGVTVETNKFYCAMDVFVLPSFWEGFGIVNLEAQASGLPCIVSNQVPKEADISGKVEFLPLNNPGVWVDHILRYRNMNYRVKREEAWHKVQEAGYENRLTAQALEKLYG